MVEISTNPTEGPPTRTIGDPSTGTDAHHSSPDETPPHPERPQPSVEHSFDTVKGLHLSHMPKPQTFSIDGALISPTPSAATTNTLPSQAGSSGAPTGAVQYETKLNVLVVDDDPAIAEMIGIVLRGEDFEPHFAADGATALDLFRSAKPDLVLLDIMLPGMSGIEVLRQLRADPLTSNIPVIALTANAMQRDIERGQAAGFNRYLTKPIDIDRFTEAINSTLAQLRSAQAAPKQDTGPAERKDA